MSVIFSAEGLEAGFTFLIAGSAASAVRPRTPAAANAIEDLRILRRLKPDLLCSDMLNLSPKDFRVPSYSRALIDRALSPVSTRRLVDQGDCRVEES